MRLLTTVEDLPANAFPGEDPHDFYCTYSATTGTLAFTNTARLAGLAPRGIPFAIEGAKRAGVAEALQPLEPIAAARRDLERVHPAW